jgi:hypothetical protein
MPIFKQSTIYTHQFLMVLSSDHISGATGKNASLVVKISKNGAAGVTAGGTTAEVDPANLPGVYSIGWTMGDVGVLGSLALAATATGCDPTNEFHQVQAQIFPDLSLDSSGRAFVTSNLKQNTAFTALFFMTQSGTSSPAPGLTVTGQRTFGVPGFSNVSGTIAEVGGAGNGAGWYVLSGAAADSNAACVGFKMSAVGANDSDFTLWFQP